MSSMNGVDDDNRNEALVPTVSKQQPQNQIQTILRSVADGGNINGYHLNWQLIAS